MHTILITGGAGFIGSNFIKYFLQKYPYRLINFDKLTYAGSLENLDDIRDDPRYTFIRGDIADEQCVRSVFSQGVDAVVNFAAESHVDRSIEDASPFIRTNVEGTRVLLEAARRYGVERFIQVSTDEVYGSLGAEGYFTENSPLNPSSPYSASKAAADLLALAYYKTYNLPVIVTRCSNNYGPYQFPEKLIPLMITNALEDRPLPVYGDGLNVRDWLHVWDHCAALDLVLHKGRPGEIYNIGGSNERTNIEIVRRVVRELGKPESLITFVRDRPGHDRRYAIDAAKLRRELGWQPAYDFEQGLKETIRWYCENRDWWRKIKSGEYRDYYRRMYAARLGEARG
ncbi:dTDP-glucose 4,6-dehydratase [Moorella sp. E308F]|uniref:dTDP-glucose 4,6-dehydratase n=1 Tax=Moorella sp. E308F TaxID=2572682 RepID=UPI0010FFC03D|nr:dTDP-glucose 4,6-dehydratase [Moorella sp. E308F]GEA14654.1 dTDP-glucose 4,6-dehydratase [Moorella sp. E308F]